MSCINMMINTRIVACVVGSWKRDDKLPWVLNNSAHFYAIFNQKLRVHMQAFVSNINRTVLVLFRKFLLQKLVHFVVFTWRDLF